MVGILKQLVLVTYTLLSNTQSFLSPASSSLPFLSHCLCPHSSNAQSDTSHQWVAVPSPPPLVTSSLLLLPLSLSLSLSLSHTHTHTHTHTPSHYPDDAHCDISENLALGHYGSLPTKLPGRQQRQFLAMMQPLRKDT